MRAYLPAFADVYVTVDNADTSANARQRIRERICKLILRVRVGRERYLTLSCRHL